MRHWLFSMMLSLLGMFTLALPGVTQDANPPAFSTTVHVNVKSSDEVLQGLVRDLISNNLQNLHDVKVVEKNPQWTIEIIVDKVLADDGGNFGVALAILVTKSIAQEPTQEAAIICSHALLTGEKGKISDLCDSIATFFNLEQLTPERERWKIVTTQVDE